MIIFFLYFSLFSLLDKNSTKLFVHSSKYEGLPTVLIEALICNKMIISSNCPTGPKDILEKKYGILVEMGNKIQFENEEQFAQFKDYLDSLNTLRD